MEFLRCSYNTVSTDNSLVPVERDREFVRRVRGLNDMTVGSMLTFTYSKIPDDHGIGEEHLLNGEPR